MIVDTAIFLYWTMFETGLAVIVACLPTFQTLMRRISPEAILRSVRSVISLRSLRSSRSSYSRQEHETDPNSSESQYHHLGTPKSSSSLHPLKVHPGQEGVTMQSYAMRDLESHGNIPRNEGHVHTSVSQESETRG